MIIMFFVFRHRVSPKFVLMAVYTLAFFMLFPISLILAEENIEVLIKTSKNLEQSISLLNTQYKNVLEDINRLKSRKDLSLLEEIELGRLLSKALNISNQIDENMDRLENIRVRLEKSGYIMKGEKISTLRLRFLNDGLVDGPVELREKALLLKDKEEKLAKEISQLLESEKRMRLKEEAQAFLKEQSVFDEDSSIAVVKKSVKSSAEESATINKVDSSNNGDVIAEAGYSDYVPSGGVSMSSQDVKVKIEVSYEKTGILNQISSSNKKNMVIDIDSENLSAGELKSKIEILKKLQKEIEEARLDLEKKAMELEKIFRDKKK